MKYRDALFLSMWFLDQLSPTCERSAIAGGTRREKADVHDLELMVQPKMEYVKPVFGKHYKKLTPLDEKLAELNEEGALFPKMGGDKYKKFSIGRWADFGMEEPINPFMLDLFIVTPPAQWGIILAIRTGPGSVDDNFSKWIVTPRREGGCLPDGWRVKHGALWREDQLDAKREPRKGEETPLTMDDEPSFFAFLGLPWMEPKDRHAPGAYSR